MRMPYIDSNIPSYIFYGTILSEIVRIARSTLLLDDLIPRLGALFERMLKQGADRWKMIRQCRKAMDKHELSFRKFASRFENINIHPTIQWISGTWPVLLPHPGKENWTAVRGAKQ